MSAANFPPQESSIAAELSKFKVGLKPNIVSHEKTFSSKQAVPA